MKPNHRQLIWVLGGVVFLTLHCHKKTEPTKDLSRLNVSAQEVSMNSGSPQTESRTTLNEDITLSRRNAITYAVEKVRPAVVGINVIQIREYVQRNPFFDDPFFRYFFGDLRYREKVKSLGSGFLISSDGYLLTNEHVVHQAVEIIVTMPGGKKYEAKIIGSDYISDIALLKIEDKGLPFVEFGNSDDLIIGEWAIALGNPFGLFDIGAKPSVSVGVISAVDRDFGRQSNDRVYQDMIQTDASINSGNSGGPLVNCLGQVIGINTFIYSGSQDVGTSIGLGFAIPINRVIRVLKDLKEFGQVNRRFWTGLEVENINPLMARFLGLKSTDGVIVSNIDPGSPAEKAGLQVGDVILAIDENPIHTVDDIWSVIEDSDVKGGDKLRLKIVRKNRYLEVDIKLEQLPG